MPMNDNYIVLARKYRPLNFRELVGQNYTKTTLINALDSGNLHHGFLFTGTRGVGKTTIARILAKSINCEIGITSQPCGVCDSCKSIDKSESIDVIELDAASNTQVDKMRALLDGAQYVPNKSRFKIYIIDEVHMLSISSFNALLKTLEEPPAHIKFIFATTNPQKLPITILSRCLQFNLQSLTIDEITAQLSKIMQAEKYKFDKNSLQQIAVFGKGSMRDSLSILDQAIAFNSGNVNEATINTMLGVVAKDSILQIIQALYENNAALVMELIEQSSRNGVNLHKLLEDIASCFYQIANCKATGVCDNENIQKLSNNIDKKNLQIYYQITINSLRDIKYSPSDKVALEMCLLRMLSMDFDKKKA